VAGCDRPTSGAEFILFGLVCLVAAAYIASVSGNFTRIPFVDRVNTFEAVVDEASGLAVGDDVRIAGVDVGRVQSIRVERGDAVVTFEVEEDIRPTTTWQTGARWRNVIGQRFLYLYPQPGGIEMVPGDLGPDGRGRFEVERSVEVADLAAFVQNLTPLLEALDPEQQNRLLEALNETLVGRDQTIQSLVTNLSGLAATVAGEAPEVRSVIANANLLLDEYNAREDQLTGLVDQLRDLSGTLAARNGEVLDAAVDIAEAQRQLGAMIAANDDALIDGVENIRRITDSIAGQRTEFEDGIASLRQGLASYMLISRQGEWFNVRGVAVQVQAGGAILTCTTETGTQCAFPNSPQHPSADQPAADPQDGDDAAQDSPPIPTAAPVVMAPERLPAIPVVTGVPLLHLQDTSPGGEG
jgi:phospholipid/cholesterol/gamma-HCH transport system substrate-binding protein